ncbi:DEKNAAC101033 [Brettanomyces naardenensis]|uniref:DEKNAAC101033 n=1 Tax=Brettanomyces naardenensis TaxID=13370 RepID=A0A448YGV1_BRENA|nr:DEKNAAC101033 [Brettanomyces naardenensis]
MTWCLFAAGPVFGFAALKPVLISEGVYSDVCPDGGLCDERDLKFNFMFALSAVVTNATAFIVGSILDSFGPRVTGIIGSFIIAFAALCLAYGSVITIVDAYLLGYVSLAFGGPFVFISCFQLANSFPGHSGLVLALLTGCFDTSSALFMFYRVAYQNSLVKNFTMYKFFTAYLVVPLFILICQLFIMPHHSYKTIQTLAKIGETGIDETGLPVNPEDNRYDPQQVDQLERTRSHLSIRSSKSVYEEIADIRLNDKSGGIHGILHGKSPREQMRTPWFWLMCLFTTIQMLRINYFLATIRTQMTWYFDSESAAITVNKFFDLALPLGGVISIPFIGLILDNLQTVTTLHILLVTSAIIGFAGLSSYQFVQVLGICLLVVYRPFYYTAVSDYCAKVFGFETFGTVYGTIICFSGLCNMAQSYLDRLTMLQFNKDPNPVNIALLALTVLFGGSMLGYVKGQERKLKRQAVIAEAMGLLT